MLKKRSDDLTGDSLHNYLRTKLHTNQQVKYATVSECSLQNLAETVPYLQSGYEIVKQCSAETLAGSIEFGCWLDLAFKLHSLEKVEGGVFVQWEVFLKTNVGICVSYAFKLRELSRLLINFPRFRKLGLAFSEVYSRKEQIKNMLVADAAIAQFWRH